MLAAFSRDKIMFASKVFTTSILLSRQKRCLVAIKVNFARQKFWREKIMFVAIKFVWRDKSLGATSILLLRQKTCFFVARLLSQQKYACRNKTFVATKLCLRQRFCHDKHTFVATKKGVFLRQTRVCRDKSKFRTTNDLARQNCVCRDKICLLRQACFCCDKRRAAKMILLAAPASDRGGGSGAGRRV